jgi:hypothetical protein
VEKVTRNTARHVFVCTRLCLIFGNKVWPNIYGNLFGKQIRRCQWCAKQYTSSIACLEVKSYVVVPQYVIESFQSSSSSSSSSRGGGVDGRSVELELCAIEIKKVVCCRF